MTDREGSQGGYNLSGDFRGSIINIESAVSGEQRITAEARPRIFLSYSWNDDKPFVEQLQRDLEARVFDVWRDETDLPSRGPDLPDELTRAIDDCDRFVPVIGPAAFASKMVQKEWAYARRKCKAITAVWRLGEVMPEDFGRKLYFDFRTDQPDYDYDKKLDDLARRLRQAEAPPGPFNTIGAYLSPPEGAIRRAEFARLGALLLGDDSGAAAITGTLHAPGGLGKSVLAALFSGDCDTRRHFSDGVCWIEIGKAGNVVERQAALGRLLGDDPKEYTDDATGRTRLGQLLAGRRMLIILDDVWDHRHAEAFRVHAPNCRWLITTRRTDMGGNLRLTPDHVIHLNYLTEEEGVALIAGALGLDPAADYPDKTRHREIVRELGGYTLAVAIAAARLNPNSVRHVSAERLLARYRSPGDGRAALSELALGEERENNLEKSLWESYDELSATGQRRFRALGVFAPEGTFGVAAAAAVWGESESDAEDGLSELAGASLLSRAGAGRFAQHNLLRAYALALLQRAGEEEERRERHFAFYREEYGNWDRNQPEIEGRHAQISSDFDDIRHALDWGFARQPQQACDLLYTLDITYMYLAQPTVTRSNLLEQGRASAVYAGYRLGEANTIQALGNVELLQANYVSARSL